MKPGKNKITLVLILLTGLAFSSAEGTPGVDSTFADGKRLYELGDLVGAIERLEQVYEISPGYTGIGALLTSAYKYLGIELYRNDQPGEALEVWHRALRISPEDEEIQGYADRAEGEIEALKRLAGQVDRDNSSDTTESVAFAGSSSGPSDSPPSTEASGIRPDKRGLRFSGPADEEPGLEPTLRSELTVGFILPVGNGAISYEDGWLLTIGLSRISQGHRTGLRLLGTYARLPIQPGSPADGSSRSRLSITGVGLEGLFLFPLPGAATIEASTGVGIYEAAMTNDSEQPFADIDTREARPGYSAGVRFSEKIGSWYLAVESRYFRMPNSIAPNQLQFRFTCGAG
jgi:tetratricopeptide (TPR) repeat protein